MNRLIRTLNPTVFLIRTSNPTTLKYFLISIHRKDIKNVLNIMKIFWFAPSSAFISRVAFFCHNKLYEKYFRPRYRSTHIRKSERNISKYGIKQAEFHIPFYRSWNDLSRLPAMPELRASILEFRAHCIMLPESERCAAVSEWVKKGRDTRNRKTLLFHARAKDVQDKRKTAILIFSTCAFVSNFVAIFSGLSLNFFGGDQGVDTWKF